MTDRFESLEHGEVISVQHETQVLSGHRTFRVGELSAAIKAHLEKAIENWTEENNGWFSDRGIDCEALRFGSNGWQKGRIRLSLEFCPDLPHPPAHSAASSIPAAATAPSQIGQAIAPPPATPSPAATTNAADEIAATAIDPALHQDRATTIPVAEYFSPTDTTSPAPQHDNHPVDILAAIPVAGIAAVGGIAVAATAAPELHEAVTNLAPHADTTLELEHHLSDPSAPNSGGFDEIAFDFDIANSDRGIRIPNGTMELDLADLGLDFSEHELLDFEDNGMFHSTTEFINLQDLDRPATSGTPIDEVWNEISQGNWPGIN
ncbi:KGK domain-containing protein [Chamaesiphon sp.]|uniref:KGK domain-containing protein n=1 Tax=Chamaesiphon sp. TaxID=2814140 RepID=UPI0035945424